jgi:D-alanyl-D-alanine dipeptidase
MFTSAIQYTSIPLCWILFLFTSFSAAAQHPVNEYGLVVISKSDDFKSIITNDINKSMLDLQQCIPGIVIDLAYTRDNNFMHKRLYPATKTTYLRKPAVAALAAIQQELAAKGFGIKIWDAYRPYSVTKEIWMPVKDARYAADPAKGSGHNRGIAADLTIIQLNTKEELNMGTAFDNFSDTAHHDFKNLPAEVLANRALLRSVMERHGFIALDSEWWHYYFAGGKEYELLDLSFKALRKLNR